MHHVLPSTYQYIFVCLVSQPYIRYLYAQIPTNHPHLNTTPPPPQSFQTMFGLTASSILKFVFRQGKEIEDKDPRKPAPLYEQFAMDTGLSQLIKIRDIVRDPFVTFTARE